jgi:hypothetical protein
MIQWKHISSLRGGGGGAGAGGGGGGGARGRGAGAGRGGGEVDLGAGSRQGRAVGSWPPARGPRDSNSIPPGIPEAPLTRCPVRQTGRPERMQRAGGRARWRGQQGARAAKAHGAIRQGQGTTSMHAGAGGLLSLGAAHAAGRAPPLLGGSCRRPPGGESPAHRPEGCRVLPSSGVKGAAGGVGGRGEARGLGSGGRAPRYRRAGLQAPCSRCQAPAAARRMGAMDGGPKSDAQGIHMHAQNLD